MPERDGYIPGVPCWVDTSQPDPEAAARLLPRPVRLGVRERDARRVAPGEYFIGRIRGGDVAAVGSIPEGAPPMAVWNTYIWVDSADETAAKVARRRRQRGDGAVRRHGRRAGWRSSPTPRARCSASGRPKEHKGAQVVNEHGALNFNGLATRDPERRQGVLRRGVRMGDARPCRPASMWTLPGYGDHLEERNPGPARADGADGRARTGFIDVVAAHRPDRRRRARRRRRTGASPSASTTPTRPRRKATELGGEVVAAPFDAPWVRMAVIRTRRARRSSPASSCPRTPTSPRRATRPAPSADQNQGSGLSCCTVRQRKT